MLAYLFWHQATADQPVDAYEHALLAFHRRLEDVAVPGLVASGTARVQGLPWMTGDGYEDWYAVDDYSALGILNDAAVDAAHAEAHDLVAVAAGFGAGGLYAPIVPRSSAYRPPAPNPAATATRSCASACAASTAASLRMPRAL